MRIDLPPRVAKRAEEPWGVSESAIRQAFRDAPRYLGRPSEEAVRLAVAKGDATYILADLNWEGFRAFLTAALERAFMEEFATAARVFSADIRKAKRPSATLAMSFDLTNPRVRRWVSRHAGELITNVTDEVRAGIRSVIERQYTEGIYADDAVPLIRTALGEPALFPRWQQAVVNYLSGLVSSGVDPDRAEGLAEAYRERLVDARALMIARTEVISAQAAGRQEGFQQALEQGLIDQTWVKQWSATPDEGVCPLCEALDGEQADILGTFPDGLNGPPAHPNCRCSVYLVEA